MMFNILIFFSIFGLCLGSCCKNCNQCNCSIELMCPKRAQLPSNINPVKEEDLENVLLCLPQSFASHVILTAEKGWNTPFLNQKHKALISIAVDLIDTAYEPMPIHIGIARRFGANDLEISEALAFLAPYVGYPRVFAAMKYFAKWNCTKVASCSNCDTSFDRFDQDPT